MPSVVDSSETPPPPANTDMEMEEDDEGGSYDLESGGEDTGVAAVNSDLPETVPETQTQSEIDDADKRSPVWKHFTQLVLPNGVIKNKCNHCRKMMSQQPDGTTSHLMKHLTGACPYAAKNFPNYKSKASTSKSTRQTQLQSVMCSSEGAASVITFQFSFEKVLRKSAHMVLAHEYSFSMMEHKVFNEFLKAYTPYYRKISRYMVRKECFIVYDEEKEKIKLLLKSVDRISLTTDCWWSGVQRIGYMVITGHYLDGDWKLQKRVLSFVNVPPPHNGAALAREVHRVCNAYGIQDKICSVTVDNAGANDACIAILKKDHNLHSNLVLEGKLFHVRCCAHVINLLVRDGLTEIEPIVEMVREGVKYLLGSENRLNAFNEHRINLKLPANKLVLDNNTRWNSTYVMLNTAYTYRDCFLKYCDDDESFVRFCPSYSEWLEVHEVCEFLEIFLDVTNLISGSNYPTVNLFLLELYRIKEMINSQLDVLSKKHMQNMAEKMRLKFDKYWDEVDLLLCFGSMLDPRYRKDMIDFTFKSMYPDDYKLKIKHVHACFQELFQQYSDLYGDSKGKGPEKKASTVNIPPQSTVGKRKFTDYILTTRTKVKNRSEWDMYLDEEPFPVDAAFDALDWWKGSEGKYKILSKMAKDILSIPITTVASESTFSAGGRVIDKRRACMRRDTIEVLLCGGDWIKEMYGIRSEGNDDPPEMEFENEYDLKDPHSSAGGSTSVQEAECTPSNVNPQSTASLPEKHNSVRPPKNNNKKKKARKT